MSNFIPGDVVYFAKSNFNSVPLNSLGVIIGDLGLNIYSVYIASRNEPNRDIKRFFTVIGRIVSEQSLNLFTKHDITDGPDRILHLQSVMGMPTATGILSNSIMVKDVDDNGEAAGILFGLKEAKPEDIRLPLGLTLVDKKSNTVEVARNEKGIIWLFSKEENKLYKNDFKRIIENFSHIPEIELLERLSHMLMQTSNHTNDRRLMGMGSKRLNHLIKHTKKRERKQ